MKKTIFHFGRFFKATGYPWLRKLLKLAFREGFQRSVFLGKSRQRVFIEMRKSIVDIELIIKISLFWFKSASKSSELNLLTEKPEKSLRLSSLDFGFLKKVWETQNCEKWSLISETILPLVILASTLLVKIFSIKVVELLCTRVGLSVVGIIESFVETVKIPGHGGSHVPRDVNFV